MSHGLCGVNANMQYRDARQDGRIIMPLLGAYILSCQLDLRRIQLRYHAISSGTEVTMIFADSRLFI